MRSLRARLIGYAAFAFALGVTAGLLIRRTLPAMAVPLGVFAVVQIAWPIWVRAHLIDRAPPRVWWIRRRRLS